MRAISTPISPETGAGGFILPNDRVDVVLIRAQKTTAGEVYSSDTILSNVRVLASIRPWKKRMASALSWALMPRVGRAEAEAQPKPGTRRADMVHLRQYCLWRGAGKCTCATGH